MVDNVLEHQHVAVGIFLLPEQGVGDSPRGVIHGSDQGQIGASALKPVVASHRSAAASPPVDSAPVG